MTYKNKLNYAKIRIGDCMTSRMEKFHGQNTISKRTDRNKELYKTMYNESEYTNIEGVVETDKLNTVNIDKLKETLEKREKQTSEKKQLVRRNIEIDVEPEMDNIEEDTQSYDIKDILNKAKEEKTDDEIDRYRSLKLEEYTLLKKIKDKKGKINLKETDEEIKDELMNTMNISKEELGELEDSELGLDLFSDLKNNSIGGDSNKSIQELINEAKEDIEKDDNFIEDTAELDNCFNTSSMKLSKKDFEEDQELDKIELEKKPNVIGITLKIIALLSVIIAIIYFGYNFLK